MGFFLFSMKRKSEREENGPIIPYRQKQSFWSYHQAGNLLFTETALTRWAHITKFIYILSHNRNGEKKKRCILHILSKCLLVPSATLILKTFLDKDFAVFPLRGRGIGRRVSLINTTFLKINIFSGDLERLKRCALAAGQMEAALPTNAEPAAIDGAARTIPLSQQRASNLTSKG